MGTFSDPELEYLRGSGERQRAQLTIPGKDGVFKLVPVQVAYDEAGDAIEIPAPYALHVGVSLPADRIPEVKLVVDDLASIEPWEPRGFEVTGDAEALTDPPRVRIHPRTVSSWGLAD